MRLAFSRRYAYFDPKKINQVISDKISPHSFEQDLQKLLASTPRAPYDLQPGSAAVNDIEQVTYI